MNKLIEALGNSCTQHPLAEKYLICPSLRTGQIWLERTASSGRSPINVRLKTIKGMAFELADTYMRTNCLKPVSQYQSLIILHQIFTHLLREGSSYFNETRISMSLLSGILNTINTLRMAGLTADQIELNSFEAQLKGLNIRNILEEYKNALVVRNLVDYSDVLLFAASVVGERFAESRNVFVMIPEDIHFLKLEQDMLKGIPTGSLIPLITDSPSSRIQLTPRHDSDLLVQFSDPSGAPEAKGDGSALIFRALGPSNEIREVLRRIIGSKGLGPDSKPLVFDHVEILHTDYDTYVPVIYETLQSFMMSLSQDFGSLPVTFAEGVPVKYSRPARALNSWLKWENDDHPQNLLVEMIADGLLRREPDDELPGNRALVQTLRKLRIISGLERTGQILRDRRTDLLAAQQSGSSLADAKSAVHDQDYRSSRDEIRCLESLVSIVDRLGVCSNLAGSQGAHGYLAGAVTFLEMCARSADEMDNYALVTLLENLRQMREAIEPGAVLHDFDFPRWISGLTQKLRIMGSGPRPGMLHVDNIHSGGHTGRAHTFIVGMDDDRFPGTGAHDPLLMDTEREKLSGDLPQSRFEPGKRIQNFGYLLARLRGNICMSYSCLDVNADRSSFPSAVLFSAYRILSNQRDSDQTGMLEWLGLPASFAAQEKENALTLNEWLLSAFCSANVSNKTEILTQLKPDIMNGLTAARFRLSDEFTSYDGHIGALAQSHDPTNPMGPVMSSASLETIGSCPLKYFFKYVLKIRPLDSIERDHSKWLDNLQLGSLLHDTFYHFMTEMVIEGRHPNTQRDKSKLFKLLDGQLDAQAATTPPPNKSSMRRQVIWLEKSSLVFLVEEEIASREWSPMLLEASIGLKNKTGTGSLERCDPIRLDLNKTSSIRIGGKIDRVDQRLGESGGEFRIIDYKTGNPKNYQDPKYYSRGKIVQHAIYLHMAEAFLRSRERQKNATFDFAFFFPTVKAYGLRILKNEQECRLGTSVVRTLCDIIANGTFLATVDATTCSYCDYSLICGNAAITSACSRNKLDNPSNIKLESFRKIFSDA